MTSFIPIENVKFNKRLDKIVQHPDKVALTFQDGEVAECSMLAGADGIQGVITIEEAEEIFGQGANVAKQYFGDERCCITYRITSGTVSFPSYALHIRGLTLPRNSTR